MITTLRSVVFDTRHRVRRPAEACRGETRREPGYETADRAWATSASASGGSPSTGPALARRPPPDTRARAPAAGAGAEPAAADAAPSTGAASAVAAVDAVDDAMRGIGFPMGPFELIDAIGADVNFAVSTTVFEQFFGDPRYRPHPLQRALVESGRLGRKSNGGCYEYKADGERGAPWSGLVRRADGPQPARLDPAQIEARILAAIVNEAASAVADGVATPDAVDTAMRLGTNWPEGPLAWGERIGLASVVHTLDALHRAVPDGRYRTVPLLRSLSESGGSFFGSSA